MPYPADLRVHRHDGTTFVTAGQMIIACYPDGDVAMRNVAVAVARQLGFSGKRVAEVMGLTDSYVATLRQRALREGAAGLVRPSGPRPGRSPQAWARAAGLRAAGAQITEGQVTSRYAGAMLLHAFGARAGAGDILGAAAGDGGPGGRRLADVGLLSAVSTCFALGAATIEQFKHLTAEAARPLAGLTGLPGLRTLRPRLAPIADGCDPLELQAMFASARVAPGPGTSGGYYVA